MGRGSYTAADWASLRSQKGLVKNRPVENVFESRSVCPEYDSARVKLRESCDSPDSPKATPVILGFDVTASMGYLARELAVNALNRAVTTLCREQPITNPHILCAAIGDSRCDAAPLQVTQFEADIRMVRQLTELYLEGGGGGNGGESYNLLWYFAAKHTKTDAWEKRGEKGILITIGNDFCHPDLTPAEIRRVFGDAVPYTLPNRELLMMAAEKWRIFHIHMAGQSDSREILSSWQRLLPGGATELPVRDVEYLADLITGIISTASGMESREALKRLDQRAAERIAASMALIGETKKEQKQGGRKVITF